jgi:hypothetical protein
MQAEALGSSSSYRGGACRRRRGHEAVTGLGSGSRRRWGRGHEAMAGLGSSGGLWTGGWKSEGRRRLGGNDMVGLGSSDDCGEWEGRREMWDGGTVMARDGGGCRIQWGRHAAVGKGVVSGGRKWHGCRIRWGRGMRGGVRPQAGCERDARRGATERAPSGGVDAYSRYIISSRDYGDEYDTKLEIFFRSRIHTHDQSKQHRTRHF